MRKIPILLIGLIILSLSACSNQQKTTQVELKGNKQQTVNQEKSKTTELSQKSKKDDMNVSDENNNSEKDIKKETEQSEITQQEIQQVKKEYSEKLEKLETLWWYDKIDRLRVLANANCTWVCNLDMKDKLSPIELQVAQDCYKQCVEKQNQAKKELEKVQEQLNQEKQAYPEKCFQDAKQRYEQMEKEFSKMDKNMKWPALPSEKEFVKSYAERWA